jgi:hypothetical protein
MDTKKLVVGQDVYILSGCYIREGKVVALGPHGVNVQAPPDGGDIFRFRSDGRGCDGMGTHECGPWYIVGGQ